MKKWIGIVTIICLSVCLFAGCKGKTVVESCEEAVSTDMMLYESPLIFMGRVCDVNEGHYSNPDGSIKAKDGNSYYSWWLTPYTIDILDVYKGNLRKDMREITVCTRNFASPEDMKKNKIVDDSTESLSVGDTMVFCVTYAKETKSYVLLFGKDNACFASTEQTNVYSNWQGSVDITNIKERIAEVMKTDQVSYYSFDILEEDKAK